MNRRTTAAVLVAASAFWLSACGGDASGSNDAETSDSTGSTGGSAPADLCALVTDDELTDLLGTAPEGEFIESALGGSSCLWTDAATNLGLELGIAPEGVPAGDGVREVAGVLFFPLGDREANLKFIDFEGGDHLDEIRPLVEAIQSR